MNRFFNWLLRRDETVQMLNDALTEIHRENLDNMQRIAVMREKFEALMSDHEKPDSMLRSEIAHILKETDYE